jgi:hypothetical protein
VYKKERKMEKHETDSDPEVRLAVLNIAQVIANSRHASQVGEKVSALHIDRETYESD